MPSHVRPDAAPSCCQPLPPPQPHMRKTAIDAAERLWSCQGCHRTFHHSCRQAASAGLVQRCQQCATRQAPLRSLLVLPVPTSLAIGCHTCTLRLLLLLSSIFEMHVLGCHAWRREAQQKPQRLHVRAPLSSPAARCSHPCFACSHKAGPAGTVRCSMASCTRRYHWECLASHPLARISASGRSAKCPLHYCAACGASGDGVPMVQVCRRQPGSLGARQPCRAARNARAVLPGAAARCWQGQSRALSGPQRACLTACQPASPVLPDSVCLRAVPALCPRLACALPPAGLSPCLEKVPALPSA